MKRLLATVTVIAPLPQHAQAVSIGEGEAKKCGGADRRGAAGCLEQISRRPREIAGDISNGRRSQRAKAIGARDGRPLSPGPSECEAIRRLSWRQHSGELGSVRVRGERVSVPRGNAIQQFHPDTVHERKGRTDGPLQKGAPIEVRGVCNGLDEMVRLSKCEL